MAGRRADRPTSDRGSEFLEAKSRPGGVYCPKAAAIAKRFATAGLAKHDALWRERVCDL